ncbi:MAG: PspC domain-containing protein [Gemmatimonadetes bacterium]|nr:PspC domain-containing protein [Gemmatimonadota bacterium]
MERTPHLSRSTIDRVIAGVAGGIGRHWGIDVTWVRLGFAVATLFWGLGPVVYALLWITLPELAYDENDEEQINPPLATESPQTVIGIVLVSLGLLMLWWKFLTWVSIRLVVAVALIAVGAFLLKRRDGGR